MVSNGPSKITNAAFATSDPGDEVILVAPYWASYEQIVALAGGMPVVLRTTSEDGLKLKPEALADALTKRSKLLILNAPAIRAARFTSRPSCGAGGGGGGASEALVVPDEVYEYFAFEGEP